MRTINPANRFDMGICTEGTSPLACGAAVLRLAAGRFEKITNEWRLF